MSRIGARAVSIIKNVKVTVGKDNVLIEGPKGKLQFPVNPDIKVIVDNDKVKVQRTADTKKVKSLHGLTRAMIANMIKGVNEGYSKQLEIVGVGFRAQLAGKKVTLQLGYSHPIEYIIPEGITLEVPKPTQIFIKGIDRQKVGQVAADLRRFFPPEPYKGKGIKYVDEQVRRKAGKAVAK